MQSHQIIENFFTPNKPTQKPIEEKKLTTIFFSPKKPKPKDGFISVDYPFTVKQYSPSQINNILINYLEHERYKHLALIKDDKGFEIFNTYLDPTTQEKIALFKVSKDKNADTKDVYTAGRELHSVDIALEIYQANKLDCDKLIIPLAEIVRQHFRLLVIFPKQNNAIFYDSKSISWPMELGASVISSLREDIKDSQDNAIKKTVTLFTQSYWYILNVFIKHFYSSKFCEKALGHQSLNNHMDCGPYVVEYAKYIIEGKKISSDTQLDINTLRGWQHEMLNIKKEMQHPSAALRRS